MGLVFCRVASGFLARTNPVMLWFFCVINRIMAPHDLWELNMIVQNDFHYSYIDNVLIRGLGYPDPYQVYESLVDIDWIDPEENDGSIDTSSVYERDYLTESETDDSDDDTVDPYDDGYMQQVLDIITRYSPGTILNPIDLTGEDED